MRILAAILALVPGLMSVIADPDPLGIGLLVVYVVPIYVAWRTKLVGGIMLIVIGILMLALFFTNLKPGIPEGFLPILFWMILILFPIASGILFITAGKKKDGR
jgi:hypothetical protein